VEYATETADKHFGLKPGVYINNLPFDWLPSLVHRARNEGHLVEYDKSGLLQVFIDRQEYFFHPLVIPIPADSDHTEPTGTAVIFRDVTQVHEQQELKRSAVSTVSHQLKTPMTSLRLAIHLLLNEKIGSLNAKQTELLLTARDDSEKLVTILDDLLDLDRIESGKSYVSPTPVLPQTLVRNAIDPFLIEAKDKGITIANNVPNDLPEIMADSEKINHVFGNLFSNALRFTSPGGTITIWAREENNGVRFSIEDTGTGVPAEHIDHLFEQFYRVPGQDEKSGVGLGLSIVKEIVLAHGGTVSADSELGKGSIFHVTLPVKHENTLER
jgi:signal transduction histidine kinase